MGIKGLEQGAKDYLRMETYSEIFPIPKYTGLFCPYSCPYFNIVNKMELISGLYGESDKVIIICLYTVKYLFP